MRRSLILLALLLSVPWAALAQTPTPAHVQSTIAGSALDLLPDTNNGEVEVIAHGEPDASGFIPIVVRNNTSHAVGGASAQVAVRDAGGQLIAFGETMINHAMKPYLLNPGDVAIGFISLGVVAIPDDAEFTYSAAAGEPDGFMADLNVDVEFVEVNWIDNRIVGMAVNPSDQALSDIYLMATCFDESGMPVLSDVTTAAGPDANSTTLFQMGGVFGDLSLCERFLIAGTGRPRN